MGLNDGDRAVGTGRSIFPLTSDRISEMYYGSHFLTSNFCPVPKHFSIVGRSLFVFSITVKTRFYSLVPFAASHSVAAIAKTVTL